MSNPRIPVASGPPAPAGARRRTAQGDRSLALDDEILAEARELLAAEARALERMVETLDEDFIRAVRLIVACQGRVITTGIGKAGIIARKIGATLASTGTPSDFLHPVEAIHGDLGRVTRRDVVLAFSNSGTTQEILQLVGPLRSLGAATIAITGAADSPLARHSDVVLDYGPVNEVCPLGLAPTTSTTVMLALGDALAMAVLREREFSPEEFARFHPGGNLGRALMKVGEVMRRDESLPLVRSGMSLTAAVEAMTTTPGRPGSVLIVAADGTFAGMYTDGDLRRNLLHARELGNYDLMTRPIDEVMTRQPVTIGPDALVSEALGILRDRKIDQLAVVDGSRRPVGLLDIQDLLNIRALAWGPPT